MGMITHQKLIDALITIKEVCKDPDNDCPTCPLGREDGRCMVSKDVPDSWKIGELPEYWRALK